ncbi:ROK family protein [Glycomyces sp. TRM65418]|uniref:ROK family protein n=1 Tax=Glycomyces sp. TRM65418 TaxID=2867006 RepID=UPI001CE4D016|nr:ROK family protein [Glycomyces sp. TRM65418]MCC3764495.1 ROK family protein [Glycomyces sp. TRM65418]QZD54166.1 ROK family protein [Glycomyces sp. TRM65418]
MPHLRAATDALWEPSTNPASVAVFTTVLTRQPVSRAEIARLTGLSGAGVTKTARPFLAAGYFTESASGADGIASGPGRPTSPLAIHADREYFIGVKVTGDEVIGVVTDLRAEVRTAAHRPLESTEPGAVADAIASIVKDLRGRDLVYQNRCRSLGLAVAGDVDRRTGLVRYSPFLDWHDIPLGDMLGRATGLTTVVENDVKALAIAEWWFGEGAGSDSFALVTVGSGIGGALMLNGGMVAGSYGVAGEIGHLPVSGEEAVCQCGGRGCLETIASERAIVARVRDGVGDPDLTMTEAVRLARDGDPAAHAAFDEAGHAIGLALATVATLVGPELIIVSGEGLAAYDLFADQVQRTFTANAFGAAGRCALVVRPLPFEEWARGAAAASIQALFSPTRH